MIETKTAYLIKVFFGLNLQNYLILIMLLSIDRFNMVNNDRKKLKNHIVQDKYLAQWYRDGEDFFSLYIIKNNLIKNEVNSRYRGFWRKGFNILDGDDLPDGYYNFPEEFTNKIDSPGISVIRNIDIVHNKHLNVEARSALSLYVTLQYFRTPRYRDELESLKELFIREFPGDIENVSNVDKFSETKHMEHMLNVEEFAKKIFKFRWIFLSSVKNSSFVTSDSPCFIIDKNKSNKDIGFLSSGINIIFPLRPDICLMIDNSRQQGQYFIKLDKQKVREINKLILENAYDLTVAKNKNHLLHLTKNFDYKKHKPSRSATIQKFGEYTKISSQ